MFKKGRKGNRKRVSKKTVVIGTAVAVATAGAGGAVYVKAKKASVPQAESQKASEATVELGTISNTIVGTGNLELDEAEAVYVPSGVTIEDVFVESGDYVSAGTVLATVEKSSVLSAVEDIQEELTELDKKISQCQEDEDENALESSVSGRVKAIYAGEDLPVTEVMLEKGALMVLSLDGLMAVDLETDAEVSEGEAVTVILSDGTAVEGTVESVENGGCTVTVTDNGTLLDDQVSVADEAGTVIGKGTLYIHKPLEITGTVGTVEEISVSENEEVEAGDELLVLDGTKSDGEYEELIETREARTATLKKLLQLTKDQNITAEKDGTVQSVNVSAKASTSEAESVSSSGSAASGDSSSGTVSATKMSYHKNTGISAYEQGGNGAKLISLSSDADFSDGIQGSSEIYSDTGEAVQGDAGEQAQDQQLFFAVQGTGTTSSGLLVIPAPKAQETPLYTVEASDGTYSGTIAWNMDTETFQSGTVYQASVTLQASEGFCFVSSSIQSVETGALSGVQVSEDGKTLQFQLTFPSTEAEPEVTVIPNEPSGDSEENSSQSGENVENNDLSDETAGTGQNGEAEGAGQNSEGTGQNTATGGTEGNTAKSGSSQTGESASGTSAGASGASGSTSAQTATAQTEENTEESTETSSQYSTDVAAFTVSPDENRILSVSVDELDINSVELNQAATVTFDAIEDREFEGTVTDIGTSATASGGVAKYTVEITIPADQEMKEGMNASATITIEEKKDVLTLPMTALQEQGDRTFVYTKQSEDGTLSGETEVTTGLSDGSTVEITEGLSEGDTVYYMRKGTSSSENSGAEGMPQMGGDQMPQMGGEAGQDGKAQGQMPDKGQGGPSM